ncbi:unnamed protein product [Moneuplotes crassus]|uniref:Uncharacterized protein n=1 Tax=Euplotes crassus TaxID=5936 RepID=A0AAD1XXP7_EUPCR|nr:unnamed protein product [Moneuplotes crassus]
MFQVFMITNSAYRWTQALFHTLANLSRTTFLPLRMKDSQVSMRVELSVLKLRRETQSSPLTCCHNVSMWITELLSNMINLSICQKVANELNLISLKFTKTPSPYLSFTLYPHGSL